MSVIDYEQKHGKIRSKETLQNEAKRIIRLLVFTLSIMIVALSVIFLLMTNENAQKGYMLQQLKLKNENLKNQKLELATEVNNSTSFSNLTDNSQITKMQKSENKNYVTEEDNRVK